MSHVWQLRADLRNVFDLHSRHSRLEFCKWFLLNASNEYALPDVVYSEELLLKLASTEGPAAAKAQAILEERKKLGSVLAPTPDDRTTEPEFVQDVRDDGVNLIGYAHGEFGMGEHARGTARALNAVKSPFSIIDFSKVGRHGLGDDSAQHWISKTKKYSINIFCINADTLPISYFSLGRSFFSNCYNIGYWAWELSKCPPEFDLSLATQLAGADLLDWHDAEIDIRHNDQH
jgi:hypothetical protein